MSYNLFPSQITPPSVETSSLSVKGEISYDNTVWSSTAGMWGTPLTRLNEFNDAIYRADLRYAPDATLGLSPDTSNLHKHLFDGDFDTYVNIPDGATTQYVIDNYGRVNNGTGIYQGYVYPQGDVFVVFYHDDHDATANVSVDATYWDADPATRDTYVSLGAGTEVSRDSQYKILKFSVGSTNYLRRLRLSVTVPSGVSPVRISGWHYFMNRFFFSDVEPPYMSKYTNKNTLNGQLLLKGGTTERPGTAFSSTLYDPTSNDPDNGGRGKYSAGIAHDSTAGQERIRVIAAKAEALTLTDTGNAGGEGLVGINQTSPSATLDVGGTIGISQGGAPSDPAAGKAALWLDSGTGDLKVKINFGGVVKTFTLADYSS